MKGELFDASVSVNTVPNLGYAFPQWLLSAFRLTIRMNFMELSRIIKCWQFHVT